MITVAALRSDIRMAGRVKRYHTWPHIREQSVAEHTWQLLRIVLCIWPGASRELIHHVMFHDIGELQTGDPPYPIKADNPILKKEMDRLEYSAQREIEDAWQIQKHPEISELERYTFKLAEFIEMWEWGLEETLLGNQFARLVAARCREVAITMTKDTRISHPARETIAELATEYMNRRSKIWTTE